MCGMVLFTLVMQRYPYDEPDADYHRSRQRRVAFEHAHHYNTQPALIPQLMQAGVAPPLVGVIGPMLASDPTDRPTLEQLLQMEWLL
jgi:hypothetical protein